MGASSRSRRSRRRRGRPSSTAPASRRGTVLLNGNEVAAAGLLVGFVLLLVGIALLTSDGTGEGGATTSPGGGAATSDGGTTASPAAATSPGDAGTGAVPPAMNDEEAIQSLSRRSIEVLPAGQWPSLYDSFTSEFQRRCPREQFDQAGEDAAVQLGDDLKLLRFKRTEGVTIEGSTAQAVIVGEIVGQSEYQVQATFQKEDGDWKIAPAPDTQGCEAFLGG